MEKPLNVNNLRRLKLTRERIIEAALKLAQSDGLEAISMRQVARILNVEAMSLYKYIENKDDLLDGVIESIVRQIELPDANTSWKQALYDRAISEKQILCRHAWIIHLLEARSGTGVQRLRHQNHMIGILRRSGFSIELAFQTMVVITGYVYGFVVFATAWSDQSKERKKTIIKAHSKINPEDHPYVMEAIHFVQSRSGSKGENNIEFEFGLRLLIDGIEKSLIL